MVEAVGEVGVRSLSRRRTVRALLVALATVTWAGLVAGSAVAAEDLTALTNSDRVGNGRRTLTTAGDLQGLAQRRADEMAAARTLSHTPELGKQVSNWRKLGENVGRGKSLGEIERSYMGSVPHRENILSVDFTEVGVGVAVGGEHIYTAVIFRLPATTPAPAPPPASNSTTTSAVRTPRPPRPARTMAKAASPAPAATPATVAPALPPATPVAPPADSTSTTVATTAPPLPAAPVEASPVPVETAPPTTSAIPAIADWMLFPPVDLAEQSASGAIAVVPDLRRGVPGALAASGIASLLGAWMLFGAVLRSRRAEAPLRDPMSR